MDKSGNSNKQMSFQDIHPDRLWGRAKKDGEFRAVEGGRIVHTETGQAFKRKGRAWVGVKAVRP